MHNLLQFIFGQPENKLLNFRLFLFHQPVLWANQSKPQQSKKKTVNVTIEWWCLQNTTTHENWTTNAFKTGMTSTSVNIQQKKYLHQCTKACGSWLEMSNVVKFSYSNWQKGLNLLRCSFDLHTAPKQSSRAWHYFCSCSLCTNSHNAAAHWALNDVM